MADDLRFFVRDRPVFNFPAWDTLPFEPVSPQLHISATRLNCISNLLDGKGAAVVAPIEALIQRLLPANLLKLTRFSLETGEALPRQELLSRFEACGFRRVSLVEEIGDLAVRGGVIDCFPSSYLHPIRMEFLDDRIERIRTFDTNSQRSTGSIEKFEIIPVREALSLASLPALRDLLPSVIERVKQAGREHEVPPREIAQTVNTLRRGADAPALELAQAVGFAPLDTFFDYLPDANNLLVIDNEINLANRVDSYWELIEEREQRTRDDHHLLASKEQLYLHPSELSTQLSQMPLCFLNSLQVLGSSGGLIASSVKSQVEEQNIPAHSLLDLSTRLKTQVGTGNALRPLKSSIAEWREKGYELVFIVGSVPRAERLRRLLLDLELDVPIMGDSSFHLWEKQRKRSPLAILIGHVSAGVVLPSEQLVLISENEIFGERSYRKVKQKSERSLKRLMSSLSQLTEGDHVVHTDYGVGIYQGLYHREIESKGTDLLQIEYADSTLYVPVQNISRVQRFVGAEGQAPKLDKLGSKRWEKTKAKVRQSVISLAGDLIKLYAARSVAKGWRYEPYGAEDERFADNFPFDETPDQLKAIQETLSDLACDRPMDRLVCGDVGFGKTEVALRAAFKCIQHSKQVGLLAPTTILVEQHYETFRKRFADYPVRIGVLSRFYSPAENRETLELLSQGKIDIVVGTHKLLQKSVNFRDLGLLIVDEEHRFGVKQKETLKQFKQEVDVLSLTATPIPRTMYMSLINIRDVSIISTPPTDRQTIRTYLANHEESLIRDAILRELQRQGQCFFVHNRVQGIEEVTARLSEIVPEARFQFAHGQMTEVELEKIMHLFIRQEIDVLVCTTIIESGLDIPNVNTMLINRADAFGLAQLYQLRGRVGRSSRQAYCYFLIPARQKLGRDAQRRLQVLQSLDDLGQGFQLAIQDLEIRGAGNLLGREQSGNVLSVGFELYTKILNEAIHHLKGEDLEPTSSIDPEVNIEVDAFIPEVYVPDLSERLVLYQRLAGMGSPEERFSLSSELEDRFGYYGVEVANLLELMSFRCALRRFGVVRADLNRAKLTLSFHPQAPIDPERMLQLVKNSPKTTRLSKNMVLTIDYEGTGDLTPEAQYHRALRTLEELGA